MNQNVKSLLARFQSVAALLLMVLALSLHPQVSGTFMSQENVLNVLRQISVNLCLSLGMTATGSLLTPITMHAIFNAEMLLLFHAWPELAG